MRDRLEKKKSLGTVDVEMVCRKDETTDEERGLGMGNEEMLHRVGTRRAARKAMN